jgi:hypothetical protein
MKLGTITHASLVVCPNGHQNTVDKWRLNRFLITCDECGIRWEPGKDTLHEH